MGMFQEFLRRIMDLHGPLHLRVGHEEFSELPKEFSTLEAELRLRDVPGKSVQRLRWRGWIHVFDGLQLEQPTRSAVLRVSRTPRDLLHPLALSLTLRLRACAQSLTDSRVRSKPLSAEATRARPVDHSAAVARPDDATTRQLRRRVRRSGRYRDLHDRGASPRAGRVISGEQTRSISGERPRSRSAVASPPPVPPPAGE